jgi:hypothetical protein
MKEFLAKLARIELEVSAEKGEFTLFALLKPANSIGEWDFVVSAPWMDEDAGAAIDLVADRLKAICTKEEMVQISRIVVIETYHPELSDLLEDFAVEHGMLKMNYSHYFNQEFQRGYVMTCKPRLQPAFVSQE